MAVTESDDSVAPRPELGHLFRDTRSGRVGVVMGTVGPCVQLRPLGGGREWDVPRARLEPVPAREELSLRLALRNLISARGRV